MALSSWFSFFIPQKKSKKKSDCMAKEACNYKREKREDTEENSTSNMTPPQVQAPDDWCIRKCIENVASVVAWTPSAEVFLMQIMQRNKEFDFMISDNAYYPYYQHRIKILRRRPCPLYKIC